MSRGHGKWERAIIAATGTAVVQPVSGIVRTSVVTPSRADFTSARRAVRTLATKSEISAFYTWTCPRCLAVQDRPDPQACCITPRPMLAVCQPSRRHLVSHPAPAPGGQPPAWLSAAHAAPAGLPLPTVDNLASLAARRVWEALSAGTAPAVNVRDLVALLRLQREIDREAAGTIAQWQDTMREVLWAARKHLGENWGPFAADIRANQHLAAMWGPPPQRRAGCKRR